MRKGGGRQKLEVERKFSKKNHNTLYAHVSPGLLLMELSCLGRLCPHSVLRRAEGDVFWHLRLFQEALPLEVGAEENLPDRCIRS